jgi:hypothetical protein
VMSVRRRQAADLLEAAREGPSQPEEQEPLSLRISRFFGLSRRR